MARIFGPRLTKTDVQELLRSHLKLVEVDRLLHSTNWAGAPACVVLCGEVDILIARLFNKAEFAMTRAAAAESTEKPQDAPAASSAGESAAQAEISPGGEPENEQ